MSSYDGAARVEQPASGSSEHIRSYYGQPVIKEPVWTWEIPCYFYTGGLAGASAGLAFLSDLRGNTVLARRAWVAALAGVTVSPALLTMDLGQPARFINMLRMFKVTSPMSVGSWILSGSGATTAVAAANAWTGMFPRTARLARPAAALLGLPLSTYTAALIANTAVPAWHEARQMLPGVFAAGAALSAGATGVMLTKPDQARPARRLAVAAALLEAGGKELMERSLGDHGEPYKQGAAGKFSHIARGCILAGWGLLAARGGRSRGAAIAAGALMNAGALAARWSIFKAGFTGASDPKYVIGPQRAGIASGQRAGAARKQASPPATGDVLRRTTSGLTAVAEG
jgi:hypothetical protein